MEKNKIKKKFFFFVICSLRSRTTGSALNLKFGVQNLNYSGKKIWSIFGENLLHPNCDLSNITECPFWLWLFYEKFSYYLFQQLIFDFNFSERVDSKIFNKIHFLLGHSFKSLDGIYINEKINYKS